MLDYLISNILISMFLSGIAPSEEQKKINHYNSLSTKDQREFREIEKTKRIVFETETNQNLIENCFEDPIFCNEYKLLIKKIKLNFKNEPFVNKFNNEYYNNFDKTKFGCFCREKFDPKIYDICPIKNSNLDLACQTRHKCLLEFNLNWQNSNTKCDLEFIKNIDNFSKNKIIDYEKFDNTSIEILYSKKYSSLIKIKNEIFK